MLSAELGDAAIDSILYAGDAPAAIVEGLASRAHRAVALSGSRDELARARSRLQGAGLARSELRVGNPRSLPFAAGSFDVVIVDREDDPDGKALREAARVLKSGGRLVVVEDYERLEAAAAGANPLVTFQGAPGTRRARLHAPASAGSRPRAIAARVRNTRRGAPRSRLMRPRHSS